LYPACGEEVPFCSILLKVEYGKTDLDTIYTIDSNEADDLSVE